MNQELLEKLYVADLLSVPVIASRVGCSQNKVNYWLAKYAVPKRSISDALYIKWNPHGDPFLPKVPVSPNDFFLSGLGLGLYWGEGNKRNKNSVRLGNTDPDLICAFISFLEKLYGVKKSKFKFWLQVFSDMNPKAALHFWTDALKVSPSQFSKITVTPARGVGNYREKTKHGVLTVQVGNTKLRNLLIQEIEKLRTIR